MYFKDVKGKDTLPSPINLEFGVEGFELAPSESIGERVGHHHLLVKRDSIVKNIVSLSDVNRVHFGNGETKGTIELESGSYLLTLQFADSTHRSFREKMNVSVGINVK